MNSAGFVFRLFRRERPAADRRHRWARDRLIGGTILAVICVALLAFLMDATAVTAARGMSPAVIKIFRAITDLGKAATILWPVGVVLIALIILAAITPRHMSLCFASIGTRVGFIYLAVLLPVWFTELLKGVVGRARPFVGGSADAFKWRPFDWSDPAYASFPSGHATTAFAIAVAVGALWPRLRAAAWIYAAIILISRIVVTAHHPSDVIAGAAVGGVGALLVRDHFAKRSLAFTVGLDGRVHALPWPRWRRFSAKR